ncbi:MAG: P-loop NTPase [Spirochaetia bacterium]
MEVNKKGPFTVAVASGKGGTGKTTLSVNLAAYLSESRTIVLADLDVEEPNSDLFLHGEVVNKFDKYRMVPQWNEDACTLCGNCQQVCSFNAIMKLKDQVMVFPELCHGCYACSELCPSGALPMRKEKMGELKQMRTKGFQSVESSLDVGQEQAVPLIAQTLDFLEEQYPDAEIFIYDSPPGTSCPVIEVAKEANYIILVTEPTPFGLHDLKLAANTMNALGKDFGVLINRYGIGNSGVADFCGRQNIPIIARIPNDRKIAELYSKGELLFHVVPEVAAAMEEVKKTIEEKMKELMG